MTTTHHLLLETLWMILGACVGSFLNVCAHRIPRGLSVLRPRSRCPGCGASIRARDNVPVLGWLILGGRCRACRGPISPRYPAVEFGVGVLFVLPYAVAVALIPADPWERIGPSGLSGLLLASWAASALGALAILVGSERPGDVNGRRAAGGCGGPASSALRASAGRD